MNMSWRDGKSVVNGGGLGTRRRWKGGRKLDKCKAGMEWAEDKRPACILGARTPRPRLCHSTGHSCPAARLPGDTPEPHADRVGGDRLHRHGARSSKHWQSVHASDDAERKHRQNRAKRDGQGTKKSGTAEEDRTVGGRDEEQNRSGREFVGGDDSKDLVEPTMTLSSVISQKHITLVSLCSACVIVPGYLIV